MTRHPQPREPSAWHGYRLFYTQFRRHFHTMGAVAPSSAALARAVTAPLAAAGARRLRVLEVGAGTGVFTRAILRHLSAGDRLDIYEINPAFQPWLQARLDQAGVAARGIRCEIRLADLCQAPPRAKYDYIISGLPLNNFAPGLVEKILAIFMGALRPGGVLSYFEYPYLRDLKRALVHDAAERTRLRAVGAVVDHFLSEHGCQAVPVALNLPPAIARHVRG